MSDAERVLEEEDRLPWLEPVEDEDRRGGSGTGGLVAALVAALVALGLVVGGVFWLRDRGAAGPGAGELIAAPAGDYKEKPAEPGGMKVEGQGDAAYAASAGADVNAAIDVAALPETPVAGAGSVTAADASAGASEVASATPPSGAGAAAAKPKLAYAGRVAAPIPATGGVIQLGAFSSAAGANSAWKKMSGRFAYLKPLTNSVNSVKVGGNTLYRLRATAGGQAQTICGKLKVAGETCAVVAG